MSGDPGAGPVEFASNPNCLPRPLLGGVDGPASKVRQRAATRKRQWMEGVPHAATQSVGYASNPLDMPSGSPKMLFAASPGVAPAHTPWMIEHQKELTSKSMRAAVDLHKTRIRTQVGTYGGISRRLKRTAPATFAAAWDGLRCRWSNVARKKPPRYTRIDPRPFLPFCWHGRGRRIR